MIVRSVLVTAINLDLGGKIWWPSKLDAATRASAAPASAEEHRRSLVQRSTRTRSTAWAGESPRPTRG